MLPFDPNRYYNVAIYKRANVLQLRYPDGEWKTTVLTSDPIRQVEKMTGCPVTDIELCRMNTIRSFNYKYGDEELWIFNIQWDATK